MSLISQGLAQNLIKFDDEKKYITYVHQKKKRNFANPEEQVQAETFLKLILTYGYDPKRLRLFVPVTMGSSVKEADIIVYNDDACLSSHIVVECKKQEVSELEFTQAVEQAFSYAVAEGAKYVWVTSGIKDQYFQVPIEKPKERIAITDIPQYGVDKLARYKYAKGGGKSNGQKLFELEIVGEDELTRRFKQAHQSLWGGGELNPSSAFDELDKLIFCKIWDEKKSRKKSHPYDFQLFSISEEEEPDPKKRTEKENEELSDRIKALYEEGRKEAPEVFKEDIRLSPEKLRTVVGYLESINLGKTDLDSKGRAFETFMGSFFRGDFGQYFTPRPIVKFIVDVLPINHDSLVLDTSCGSGGFLLHALDKVRRQADEYYPDYETDLDDAKQHKDHWHRFASRKLFGIEINEQIARVAKMNMIIHDDGHTNVIAADGLRDSVDLIERSGNSGFAYNRFDFIITNPPFGSVIKQTEQAYMHQYGFAMKTEDWLNPKSKATVRENQNTEILFIEQCHRFLVDGGYLAMVVPDGILTNSSLQYVRDGIEEKYRIVAVVSMPQTAFSATGAGVKSSVLFLKKYSQAETTKIQNTKVGLQDWIKQSNDYLKQLEQIENDKKRHLKDLRGFENSQNLDGKALTDSDAYKEWKKEVTAEYNDRIDALKESLSEQYTEEKQKVLNDYPIFMAIAEDIGYDATGKPTNNNELDFISVELARFIEAIESGKDSFFLSSDVDKNKVFLVNLTDSQTRIDPYYYKPDFLLLRKKLEGNSLFERVGNLIKSWNRGDGPRDGFYTDDIQNGVYFLRVNNLKEHTN
jgi:type I restriction enzyme M protein